MKKNNSLVLAILVTLIAGTGYWLWLSRQTASAKTVRTPPPVPVTLAQATTRDMPLLLEVVGRGEAYEGVTLKSRVDGQVAAVAYTEGQHVKQGDVLLRLDPADFNARLAQAEANLARDQAQLAKAQADVGRYIALHARGFVSEEKVNDMRTNAAALDAAVRADKAAVELARLQLSYATIRAPFAGVVGARLVFPGSAVKVNDTALAVVNRVRPLYVTFSVPERHLPRLRASIAAKALKVAVTVPGDKSQRYEGEARFLDNAVDSASGTIQMKAILPNQDEKLTSGQFLNVSLVLDTLSNAVVVPSEAVQQGADGNFLFVVKEDNSVEPRKIEVLTTFEGMAAIGKGLQAGETVVTDGQLRLTPGAKVQAKQSKPEPVGAPPNPSPLGPSPQRGEGR